MLDAAYKYADQILAKLARIVELLEQLAREREEAGRGER
jgi:hypothetical protein